MTFRQWLREVFCFHRWRDEHGDEHKAYDIRWRDVFCVYCGQVRIGLTNFKQIEADFKAKLVAIRSAASNDPGALSLIDGGKKDKGA